MATIARSTSGPRVFPSVADVLSDSATPSSGPPHRLLHAATQLHGFRVRSGWGVHLQEKVTRIIAIHRLAARSEARGQWASASYLWNLRDELVARVSDEAWAASARACGFEGDADEWRRRVIHEVVLDTHCAFYNGYAAASSARAAEHLRRIDAISARELSKEERRRLLGPAWDAHVDDRRKAGDLDAAISQAEQRLGDDPDRLTVQRAYTLLVFERATAGLTENEPLGERHAAALEAGITTLTGAIRAHPLMADGYDALASLHRLRAVQLANTGRLSTALLHIAKAQSYHAELPGLVDDDQAMTEMMRTLRAQMQEVQQKLAANPDLGLSPEGQRLRYEAESGFSHVTAYRGTQQDLQIRAGAERARAWRLTADAAPSDDGPAEAAAHPEEAPVVPVAAAQKRSARDPLTFWLFTRRDPLLKSAMAAAIVVALAAAALTAKAALDVRRLESAWTHLVTTAGRGDDLQVVEAAERFLSMQSSAADVHVEEALELYEAALVRWFATLEGPLGDDALRRLEVYRRLSAQVSRGGRT